MKPLNGEGKTPVAIRKSLRTSDSASRNRLRDSSTNNKTPDSMKMESVRMARKIIDE